MLLCSAIVLFSGLFAAGLVLLSSCRPGRIQKRHLDGLTPHARLPGSPARLLHSVRSHILKPTQTQINEDAPRSATSMASHRTLACC